MYQNKITDKVYKLKNVTLPLSRREVKMSDSDVNDANKQQL